MADRNKRGKPGKVTKSPGKEEPQVDPKLKEWLQKNTYHYSDFSDISKLVKAKQKKDLKISVVIPTLNEESTIGYEVELIRLEYMEAHGLVDEIIVVDSGSIDATVEIARDAGATVYYAADILPQYGTYLGKGENLWKSLYVAKGDIILWIDADIKNVSGRFIYGILGPLLLRDDVLYSKAFYQRPLHTPDGVLAAGGGRVTEILIRPLFNYFFKDLTGLFQPLSGEYAGYRTLLEKLPFSTGYGVETGLLIDIYENFGLDKIAQVDLNKRIHRNRPIEELSKMAFQILKTFIRKCEDYGYLKVNKREDIKFFNRLISERENYNILSEYIDYIERPPMIEIKEYREKFSIK